MGDSDDQLIWLEHSRVWARVPRSHNGPNKRRKYEHRMKTPPERNSEDNVGHMVSDGEAEGISCSVCLDEVKTYHKAVITPCMHEYHHTCISKWLTMKQECPLCKSQVHTVLYNIQDDGSFLERELNLPLKHVTNREDIMRRLADILGEGLVDLVRYQIGRRVQQQSDSPRNISQDRHNNNSTTASTRHGGIRAAAGPTPYSMRVQHHANARRHESSTLTSTATTTAPSSRSNFQIFFHGSGRGGQEDEEALIAWRREIYDLELYAVPLGTHHHVPRSLSAPAGRHNRIKEWLHRELQALLTTDHTTILRGFVMGLLATYGAHPPLPPSRLPPTEILALQYGDSARRGDITRAVEEESEVAPVFGRRDDTPVSQLRPFLGAAAGHFWHELSCFATAPAYTIRTYDSLVRYARPGEKAWRKDRNRDEESREPRERTHQRRQRQRSHDRYRSRSRASRDRHHSSRRRRHEEEETQEEEEENQRRHFGPERSREVEAEQPENARWKMWQWGDPVYE